MDIYFRAILFWLIFVNHEICSSNVRLIMLVDEAVSKGTRYAKYTELANAQLVISSYSMMLTVAISRLRHTVSRPRDREGRVVCMHRRHGGRN